MNVPLAGWVKSVGDRCRRLRTDEGPLACASGGDADATLVWRSI